MTTNNLLKQQGETKKTKNTYLKSPHYVMDLLPTITITIVSSCMQGRGSMQSAAKWVK